LPNTFSQNEFTSTPKILEALTCCSTKNFIPHAVKTGISRLKYVPFISIPKF